MLALKMYFQIQGGESYNQMFFKLLVIAFKTWIR